MPGRRRTGGASVAQLGKALHDKVKEAKVISEVLKASGHPLIGSVVRTTGYGRKPKKGGFFGSFLGLGKAPRQPKKGGWGFLRKLIKAPIQVATPAILGGIGGLSGGLEHGIDNVGKGRRRGVRRGGMKMVPAVYQPVSQLTR